jgi:periplasmic divalent cation tolerance protein
LSQTSYIVILSTVGNVEEASRIAEHLVSNHLVACVNIIRGIQSVYWWKDQVQRDEECLMLIKTEHSKFAEVEQAIRSLHSYEVPEVISLPLENGSTKYLQWIENSLKA